MAVFMIVPMEDAERFAALVTKAFDEKDRFILPGRQACYVKFSGTTKELSDVLDLAGTIKKENRPCPAIITVVTGYGGFALTTLWEWLQSRMGS